jgi:two-component system sensor histidine kinase KdpD
VATQAVERAQPRAALAGAAVALEIDGPVPVRSNPRLLGRILDNLINNALTHGRHPGRVVLSSRRHGGYGEVAVEDDGAGLSQAAREHLFTPLSEGADSAALSSGLGLYICRALAEQIGGVLRLEDNPGGGTTFVVELPLALS